MLVFCSTDELDSQEEPVIKRTYLQKQNNKNNAIKRVISNTVVQQEVPHTGL
jgi:hypothetical protein